LDFELAAQRLLGLAAGYEDLHDAALPNSLAKGSSGPRLQNSAVFRTLFEFRLLDLAGHG
jgi:hypothetical protein